MTARAGSPYPCIEEALTQWEACREALAAIEKAEHPDITDLHGRMWIWAGRGGLYIHDETIAIPEKWIADWGLPTGRVAINPNYDRLCGICRGYAKSVAA